MIISVLDDGQEISSKGKVKSFQFKSVNTDLGFKVQIWNELNLFNPPCVTCCIPLFPQSSLERSTVLSFWPVMGRNEINMALKMS